MLASGRAVDLRIGGEDPGLLLLGQADAGVGHLEMEEGSGAGRLPAPDPHDDFTRVGELDRVAEQVDEDLPEPAWIADRVVRNIRPDVEDQLDAFVCSRLREQLDRLLCHVLGAEVDALHAHTAGLDLGEVEDVVDDLQQRVAGGPHCFHVVALLRGEVRLHQQAGHADHPVHRGADLVAHRRQELRLHAGKLLELLVALPQVGHQLRPGRLRRVGHHAVFPLLLHHPPDEDSERHEEQAFEKSGRRVAGGRVHARDQDQVRRPQGGADGKFHRRVIKGEEHQQQQHEGEGADHAQSELDL